MDILIVKPKWADKIFLYHKTWEIRGCNTTKRGTIGIAKSGTGCVYGEVDVIDSIPLNIDLWEINKKNHQVELSWEEVIKIYKNPYAWIFDSKTVFQYQHPIQYNHPKGAVIWVKDNNINQTFVR